MSAKLEIELKPGDPWCFCPKCAHLKDFDKPWKILTCTACDSTGKISLERICEKRICGHLREECICGNQA